MFWRIFSCMMFLICVFDVPTGIEMPIACIDAHSSFNQYDIPRALIGSSDGNPRRSSYPRSRIAHAICLLYDTAAHLSGGNVSRNSRKFNRSFNTVYCNGSMPTNLYSAGIATYDDICKSFLMLDLSLFARSSI